MKRKTVKRKTVRRGKKTVKKITINSFGLAARLI